jgi:hypothetical protein
MSNELADLLESMPYKNDEMKELEHSRNMYMRCLNRLEDFVADKGLIDEFQKWKRENNR